MTTLIHAIESLKSEAGASDAQIGEAVRMLRQSSPNRWAVSDPREEVLIRFTVGTGEWSEDKKFNLLRMKMFHMDGSPDGYHDGVWEPQVPLPELMKQPPPPKGPLDKPAGPVPHPPVRAYTKAIWGFGDGTDSITAVGPAMLFLARLSDDSHLFTVAVSAIITNGTGRYDGAQGVKTALGSTFVPVGADLADPPGGKFGAVTIETFRVLRSEYL